MTKWPWRRHDEAPSPSPPCDDPAPGAAHAQVSSEAQEALRLAQQAQRDVNLKKAQLAPLMRQIKNHLAKNEIAETVAANFVRRPA